MKDVIIWIVLNSPILIKKNKQPKYIASLEKNL